jgi:hypothetical protein
MVRTQIYLPKEELSALHAIAQRRGTSVAQIVREAVRRVWIEDDTTGASIVGLASATKSLSSVEHDAIYDEP